jgi:hypothetical protein
LSVPGLELFDGARQDATWREGLANKGLQTHPSSRLVRVEQLFNSRYLVAQTQSPFLQPPHQKFVERALAAGTVYHGVKIAVLNAQLDQSTFGGVQVGVQGSK